VNRSTAKPAARRLLLTAAALLLGGLCLPAAAQEPYRLPPAPIPAILSAPPLPRVSLGPDGSTLLLLEGESLPPIAELAQPMLSLAGQRVNPLANAPFGPRTIVGLQALRVSGYVTAHLAAPPDVGFGTPIWSPDGRLAAYTQTRSRGDLAGVSLSLLNVQSGIVGELAASGVNVLGVSPTWMPDGQQLLVALLPAGRGPLPERSPVPTGPLVQENLGGDPAPVRTYQDLLQDAHDEQLFEYCFRSQLALIDLEGTTVVPLGPPGLYVKASPSPDGRYLLVERIERPFSRLVPWWGFPRTVEVWDREGRVVATLAHLPLAERVPIEGVITGPREHAWRATSGTAEVCWAEALDGGDPKKPAAERDRLLLLAAPFDGEPREIVRLEDRFRGLAWVDEQPLAAVSEYDRDARWTRTWLVDVAPEPAAPRTLFDRSVQDAYGEPGTPLSRINAAGQAVWRLLDGQLLLAGEGASPEGDRPFLDLLDLASLQTRRLWRNSGEEYETVVDLLASSGADKLAVLTRRETPSEPPNYFVRSVPLDGSASTRRAVTHFEHPAPELLGVHKELVTYTRDDGVGLSATLYLPAGHQEGMQYPLIVWAYPREFNDAAMAGQVRGSPWRFTLFTGASHLFLLTQGYAVLDSATMPVVGDDPETVNDSFISQIVASAAAAIHFAVERGVSDGEHVGVGGHSYGAFMTANLLAHSDLFRAGCARSGAYNRTLTPFGFQAERRTLWEAPETYAELSPFMFADDINEPLLLIHGMEDDNSGTFPLQSERLYHAIKGHGGSARLVLLPEESHGYRARESVLHTLAEMVEWFDRWVKPPPTDS